MVVIANLMDFDWRPDAITFPADAVAGDVIVTFRNSNPVGYPERFKALGEIPDQLVLSGGKIIRGPGQVRVGMVYKIEIYEVAFSGIGGLEGVDPATRRGPWPVSETKATLLIRAI